MSVQETETVMTKRRRRCSLLCGSMLLARKETVKAEKQVYANWIFQFGHHFHTVKARLLINDLVFVVGFA